MKTSTFGPSDSASEINGFTAAVDSHKSLGSQAMKSRPIGEISFYAAGSKALPTDSFAPQRQGNLKPKSKPIGVTLQVTPSWLSDQLGARMGALATIHPGSTARGAGLMLPQLGAEVSLLSKIDQDILPSFEMLNRQGKEATCAAQMLDSRDTMTELFMKHAYTELTQEAQSLGALAVSPNMAVAVRTLRLEMLLLARHRRAQLAKRPLPRAQGASPKAEALEALENSLVALVVRPA